MNEGLSPLFSLSFETLVCGISGKENSEWKKGQNFWTKLKTNFFLGGKGSQSKSLWFREEQSLEDCTRASVTAPGKNNQRFFFNINLKLTSENLTPCFSRVNIFNYLHYDG